MENHINSRQWLAFSARFMALEKKKTLPIRKSISISSLPKIQNPSLRPIYNSNKQELHAFHVVIAQPAITKSSIPKRICRPRTLCTTGQPS